MAEAAVTSLKAIRMDLLLTRNTDVRLEVLFQNPVTLVPYDLTNDTIKMTVRDGFTGAALFATKVISPGSHSAPTSGLTRILLTKTDLLDAAHAGIEYDFQHEIRRIVPSGDEVVFFSGICRLYPTPSPV